MRNKALIVSLSCLFAGACANPPLKQSEAHIRAEAPRPATIPQPVRQTAAVPAPKPARKPDTYSVVVTNVPAREILFALARDAKLNLDIHPGIQGNVTLNAIDQTLPQILSRIAKEVDMRYEVDGPNLVVMPDTPYLRTYRVDYVNMTRDTTSTVAITRQITGGGTAGAAGGAGAGGNTSTTSITDSAKNHFWETLEKNIRDILQETDKEVIIARRAASGETQSGAGASPAAPTGSAGAPAPYPATATAPAPASPAAAPAQAPATSSAQAAQDFKEYKTLFAASVIANPEAGVISVRATSRQHEKIQEFLDQVMASAKRQVMIEATIVEVQLNNQYQQGINWSRLRLGDTGLNLTQAANGGIAGVNQSLFVLNYANPRGSLGNISVTLQLLESFGTVKVLSSPKISVLNNQTALLKVADERVYFTVQATQSTVTSGGTTIPGTITATPNTISVGFFMSVTPQISDSDAVLLTVRPSVTRTIGPGALDPTPALAAAGITSRIPEIQTREMESVIKITSGQIAVMGGLMQDSINNLDDAVPGLSRLPGIGNFFTHRNDQAAKSELVIFLRPVVVKDASIDGDFNSLRSLLPDRDFLAPRPIDEPEQGGAGGGK